MQLSFDFPFQERYLPEDFIVSKANKSAFDFVKNYDPENIKLPRIFAIIGPELSGKTYLANIWKKKFGAEILNLADLKNANLIKLIRARQFYIVEDIDKTKNKDLLLQVFNLAQEKMGFLLLTSKVNLNLIDIRIRDLESRLNNVFCFEISKPDDDLIKMLLIKNFSSKQLKIDDKVVNFLVQNLKRDFVSIHDAVRLLEFYSLEKKRNITIPLVKEILTNKPF